MTYYWQDEQVLSLVKWKGMGRTYPYTQIRPRRLNLLDKIKQNQDKNSLNTI